MNDELTKKLLDLITSVRPQGIEVEAYPYIVEMMVNVITLELTRGS